MGKIIAVYNQKGGVGKTTTSVSLTSCLGALNKKILLVDLDSQGNASCGYGIQREEINKSLYDVIFNNADIHETVVKTKFDNVDIIPSVDDLIEAEVKFAHMDKAEFIIKNYLHKLKNEYDYIFIDCPPSLGLMTINSLTAADSVMIPIQCEFYAYEVIGRLMRTINTIRKDFNPDLEIQGVVLSMFDGRANLSIQVVDEVKKHFKGNVYTSIIPRNIRLAEAPSYGEPINYYDPRCKGSIAYMDLAEEFIDLENDII